jgi:pimeloyl-ACP methyl ester carboxylesterase
VLGGNSLGGHVAWRTALVHPLRVEKLILVDSAGTRRGLSRVPGAPHIDAHRVSQRTAAGAWLDIEEHATEPHRGAGFAQCLWRSEPRRSAAHRPLARSHPAGRKSPGIRRPCAPVAGLGRSPTASRCQP